MPARRKNARILKTLSPYDRILGHVMPRRSDAQVFFTDDIDCTSLDNYIEKKKAEGIEITYLDVFSAATVRMYALRPALNRFTMNGRVYANDKIYMSMAVKKTLREDAGSTTIKIPFTGHENIFDVKQAFYDEIHNNKELNTTNDTDKTAKMLTGVPNWVLKLAMSLIRWGDKHNILPASIIKASPFHGSVFITYLKSLGIPGIYHHIYDLGTIGQFIAVGKERHIPVVDEETGEVRPGKVVTLMVVADERICDGLYYARSMRLYRKLLENPMRLETRLDKVEEDIE